MFQEKISLKNHSHYKIGGPARYFFEAKNTEDIIKALDKWRLLAPSQIRGANLGSGVFILGAGTNVLFSDEGFGGAIIKIKNSKLEIKEDAPEEKIVKVDAGLPMAELVEFSLEKGFSGLEWAAGLPGTLGGAIRGNAGSFGGEMKDVVKEVISFDLSKPGGEFIKRSSLDSNFDYRSSIFKLDRKNEIIVEALLVLKKGDKKSIREIIEKNINYRKENQPLDYPSIGSIFKNVPLAQINADYTQIDAENIRINQRKNPRISAAFPIKSDPFPVIPAAYLISEAGLKGVSHGGAMISPKHPNFIVNVLNASSDDVENLIRLAKKQVKKKFDVGLEEEIVRV